MSPRHPLEGVSQIQGAARDRRRPLGLTIKRQETFARRVKARAPGRQSCKRKLLPPPARFLKPGRGSVKELLEWWNTRAPELSPVLTSAILHYRFEDIHPFADGNGRTGRALGGSSTDKKRTRLATGNAPKRLKRPPPSSLSNRVRP